MSLAAKALGFLGGLMPEPRVDVADRHDVESEAEEIYAQTDLSTHEACVLAATVEGWEPGDIGWLIGRSTDTAKRHQSNLRQRARENPSGTVAKLLNKA